MAARQRPIVPSGRGWHARLHGPRGVPAALVRRGRGLARTLECAPSSRCPVARTPMASDCLRLIPVTSPEWMEWLAGVAHDFYHTAAYHLLAQEFGEGEAFLAVYGDRTRFVAWPHLVRRIAECPGLEDSAAKDVASVYGY